MIKCLLINAININRGIESVLPPLGLGYIASAVDKILGSWVEFKVINSDVLGEFKRYQPDIVGITSVSQNYDIAKDYAKLVKRISQVPVIIGGVHISVLPSTLSEDMDMGVIGEGEDTMIDLMMFYMAEGRFCPADLAAIRGIVYWDNGELITTRKRELIQPLDKIPMPARDLLTNTRAGSMYSSRGCPHRCAFCACPTVWNKVRFFSAEYVADEIEYLYKHYQTNRLTLYDDIFVTGNKRLIKLIEILGRKDLLGKMVISINSRADLITDDLARMLKVMGVKVVAIGVESSCQRTLDYLKGKVTVETNVRAIRILQKHKIIPYCSFIIGSPEETEEEIQETVRFIEVNKLTRYDVLLLTPLPGTPVWDYAKARGLVSNNMDWGRLNFQQDNPDPVILSELVAKEKLFEYQNYLYRRKYKYQYRRSLVEAVKHPMTAIRSRK